MSRDEFAAALVAYINDELVEDGDGPVTADTELFAGGVLDSLSLLHLLAFVEHSTGAMIPDEDIVMDRFSTPERIAASFWRDG